MSRETLLRTVREEETVGCVGGDKWFDCRRLMSLRYSSHRSPGERKSASQGAKQKNCAGSGAEHLRTAFETAVLKEGRYCP